MQRILGFIIDRLLPRRRLWQLLETADKAAGRDGPYPVVACRDESRPGSTFVVNEKEIGPLSRKGFTGITEFFSPGPRATLLRDTGTRRNYSVKAEGTGFFLKVHVKGAGGGKRSPGRMEWENHLLLMRIGIRTPNPVAFGEDQERSFFVSRDCEGTPCDDPSLRLESLDAVTRKSTVLELARVIARMHRHRLFHRDLYLCHILLNSGKIFIIDLQRLDYAGLTSRHRRVKDLAALLYSSMPIPVSQTDRLRFMKSYMGEGSINKKTRRMIKAVERKSKRIEAHTKKSMK